MRIVALSLGAAALMAAIGPAAAQSRLTCSGLHQRCLGYNAGYGPAEVKKCADARKACMQSGNWSSCAFDYKNVRRQQRRTPRNRHGRAPGSGHRPARV